MDGSDVGALFFILFVFSLGFIGGIASAHLPIDEYNNLKQQCAKDNNIYECVIVAVPKGKE